MSILSTLLVWLFAACQVAYFASLAIDIFFHTRRVDWVDPDEIASYAPAVYPRIVLLYPVLRELEETMRTTFRGLAKLDYPIDRYRIVAIPNDDDLDTIASLERLCSEFSNIEILSVPPTTDPSWDVVWEAWDANPKAYWWHTGRRAGVRALPPKKTRQLIYAFYTIAREEESEDDWLLNYIDADSVPPTDHFRAGAAGIQRYDVVQSTNVAGNLLDTWASSWHAMDHMCWDGHKYPHLSAAGSQPFWVLGKGLFYKASDLLEVGSFHPWLTIEDPEVGMRLWVNGKRIGIVANPLIEEVPVSLREGVRQRKRWVCGFLQSLHTPLRAMGMTWRQRARARLNMWPCMFLMVNSIGLPVGVWALVMSLTGSTALPAGFLALGAVNVAVFSVSLLLTYRSTWRRTALVLDRRSRRLKYMLRVNPVFLMLYWVWWTVPLLIGINMFLRDRGLVWERTRKIDANHDLVRARMRREAATAVAALANGNGAEQPFPAVTAASNGGHSNGNRVVRVRAPEARVSSARRGRRGEPNGLTRLVELLDEVAATRAREAAGQTAL